MKHEEIDVVIIGAGLSGIGAAVHLKKKCKGKTFVLFETRESLGGTWDLFRYPGVRSDSDMYTLGYSFKPWINPKSIADGPDIKAYIEETAREYGITEKVRFRHRVTGLDWSSRDALWNVTVENVGTGEVSTVRARFVIACSGYYRYESGYTPEFKGRDDFRGEVIHPQSWPENFDAKGKKIVVIGSGATAVTLVPALAMEGAKVTMLQRSPSYVLTVPGKDVITHGLRRVLPEKAVYGITRAKNVLLNMGVFNFARSYPARAKKIILKQVRYQVGKDFDMKHFSPKYNVWDERLCAVPDGDLFRVIRDKKASVVTAKIDKFVEDGILLESGEKLEADVIITATGLQLQMLGGATLAIDGETVKVAEKLYYKGAMLEDVPNVAMVFGYTNSSWTLKADLICDYFCRVINMMEVRGVAVATPRRGDANIEEMPFLNLSAGYIQRAIHMLPRQGVAEPWKLYQNYILDYALMKLRKIDDGTLVFHNPRAWLAGHLSTEESVAVSERDTPETVGTTVS